IRTRTAVYAPAGAEERLTRAYHTDPGKAPSADGCEDTDFSRAFEFIDLDDRSVWQIGSLTIETFLVDHPVETYAVRITDATGSVIAYSADTDECANLV
ncbi:MBL fold metallo-hydrolase, partial [Burkholderia multivorans]